MRPSPRSVPGRPWRRWRRRRRARGAGRPERHSGASQGLRETSRSTATWSQQCARVDAEAVTKPGEGEKGEVRFAALHGLVLAHGEIALFGSVLLSPVAIDAQRANRLRDACLKLAEGRAFVEVGSVRDPLTRHGRS